MGEQQEKIKQHYVPQGYLKNFTNIKDGDIHKIYAFNKTTNKAIDHPTNVLKYAQEKYFYDFVFLNEIEKMGKSLSELSEDELLMYKNSDKQFIENFFSKNIEGKFIRFISRIIKKYESFQNINNQIAIEKECRIGLSYFIIFQLIRTRSYRDEITKHLGDTFHSKYEKDLLARFIHISDIIDIRNIEEQASLLCNKFVWTVAINNSQTPIFTSDNPVVLEDDTLIFPISSKLVLLLIHEEKCGYGYIHLDKKFIDLNDEGVIRYNNLQYNQARMFIFSENNDFSCIKLER